MIKYVFISSAITIILFILWGLFIGFPCYIAQNSGNIFLYSIIWLPIVATIGLLGLIKPNFLISQMLFIVVFIAGVFWILNLCFFFLSIFFDFGNIDYSSDIKKIAVPMQIELETFYTKNKRFPTTIERNKMLEKVGCVMEGSVCLFDNDFIKIISQESSYDYSLKLRLENTGCSLYLNNIGKEKGKISKVRCGNKPCIKFGQ